MEKWYTKFVNKNKFYIKWSHIILLHIKIRLQHRGRYDCNTTLTIAINKFKELGFQIKVMANQK